MIKLSSDTVVGAIDDLKFSDLARLRDGQQDYVVVPRFTIGKIVEVDEQMIGLYDVHFLGMAHSLWVTEDQIEVLE